MTALHGWPGHGRTVLMRITPALLSAILSLACLPGGAGAEVAGQAVSTASAPSPAPGCPSLANLRILLRQAGSTAAATAVLSDPKADHLSCVMLDRDKVTAVADQAALNGHAYDCVSVQGTSVCHWTVAGTVVPGGAPRATRAKASVPAPAEKSRR